MSASFQNSSDALVLGSAIKAARKREGLTQTALAQSAAVERSQISKIERGQNAGLSENVQRLCKYLGIDDGWVEPGLSAARLGARVERVASHSPDWARVVWAFVDAAEAAQQSREPGQMTAKDSEFDRSRRSGA